jgi:hypothetical protein
VGTRVRYWLEAIRKGMPTVWGAGGALTFLIGGSLLGLFDVLSLPWALLIVAGGLVWAVLEGAARIGAERDRALAAATGAEEDTLVVRLTAAADEMRGIRDQIRELQQDALGHLQWEEYESLKSQYSLLNEEVLRELQKDPQGREWRRYYMLSPRWLAPELTRLGEDALIHMDRVLTYTLGQVEYVIGMLNGSLPVKLVWTEAEQDEGSGDDYPLYQLEVVSRVDHELLLDGVGVAIECEGYERLHRAQVVYPEPVRREEQAVPVKPRGVVRASLSFSDETAEQYAGKQITERAYVQIAGRDTIFQVSKGPG